MTAEGVRAAAVGGEGVSGVGSFDVSDVELGDRTGGIGDPVQARVVKDDQDPSRVRCTSVSR